MALKRQQDSNKSVAVASYAELADSLDNEINADEFVAFMQCVFREMAETPGSYFLFGKTRQGSSLVFKVSDNGGELWSAYPGTPSSAYLDMAAFRHMVDTDKNVPPTAPPNKSPKR